MSKRFDIRMRAGEFQTGICSVVAKYRSQHGNSISSEPPNGKTRSAEEASYSYGNISSPFQRTVEGGVRVGVASSADYNWMAHVDVEEDCKEEAGEMDKSIHGSFGGFHGDGARISAICGSSTGGIGLDGLGNP